MTCNYLFNIEIVHKVHKHKNTHKKCRYLSYVAYTSKLHIVHQIEWFKSTCAAPVFLCTMVYKAANVIRKYAQRSVGLIVATGRVGSGRVSKSDPCPTQRQACGEKAIAADNWINPHHFSLTAAAAAAVTHHQMNSSNVFPDCLSMHRRGKGNNADERRSVHWAGACK